MRFEVYATTYTAAVLRAEAKFREHNPGGQSFIVAIKVEQDVFDYNKNGTDNLIEFHVDITIGRRI